MKSNTRNSIGPLCSILAHHFEYLNRSFRKPSFRKLAALLSQYLVATGPERTWGGLSTLPLSPRDSLMVVVATTITGRGRDRICRASANLYVRSCRSWVKEERSLIFFLFIIFVCCLLSVFLLLFVVCFLLFVDIIFIIFCSVFFVFCLLCFFLMLFLSLADSIQRDILVFDTSSFWRHKSRAFSLLFLFVVCCFYLLFVVFICCLLSVVCWLLFVVCVFFFCCLLSVFCCFLPLFLPFFALCFLCFCVLCFFLLFICFCLLQIESSAIYWPLTLNLFPPVLR